MVGVVGRIGEVRKAARQHDHAADGGHDLHGAHPAVDVRGGHDVRRLHHAHGHRQHGPQAEADHAPEGELQHHRHALLGREEPLHEHEVARHDRADEDAGEELGEGKEDLEQRLGPRAHAVEGHEQLHARHQQPGHSEAGRGLEVGGVLPPSPGARVVRQARLDEVGPGADAEQEEELEDEDEGVLGPRGAAELEGAQGQQRRLHRGGEAQREDGLPGAARVAREPRLRDQRAEGGRREDAHDELGRPEAQGAQLRRVGRDLVDAQDGADRPRALEPAVVALAVADGARRVVDGVVAVRGPVGAVAHLHTVLDHGDAAAAVQVDGLDRPELDHLVGQPAHGGAPGRGPRVAVDMHDDQLALPVVANGHAAGRPHGVAAAARPRPRPSFAPALLDVVPAVVHKPPQAFDQLGETALCDVLGRDVTHDPLAVPHAEVHVPLGPVAGLDELPVGHDVADAAVVGQDPVVAGVDGEPARGVVAPRRVGHQLHAAAAVGERRHDGEAPGRVLDLHEVAVDVRVRVVDEGRGPRNVAHGHIEH
mmetsp:Transcript_112152/g.362114  ORF Transcript_112152/g.362114 Transcript_112152/m.362114 type:complete len:537 (-) Transcript_112152:178-1788(-)